MSRPGSVQLRICAANEEYAIDLPVSADMMRELTQTFELSDEPLPLVLKAGPGRVDDYVEYRRKVLKMREWMVKEISKSVEKALTDYFGKGDTCASRRQT